MYHRFVAGKVRQAFAEISAGNWEAMVAGMAPEFTYRFYGDHALSGERHTHEALRRWWQRCFRLLPETRFEVPGRARRRLAVAHQGGDRRHRRRRPGRRHAVPEHRAPVPHHALGQDHEVRTLEDTAVLERALDRLAAAGIEEAHAAPITD